MEASKISSHVKTWQKYFGPTSLPEREIELAVQQTLRLPFVRNFLVFSSQAVVLLDLHTLKYVYVSPSMKQVLDYYPEEFTDFNVVLSNLETDEAAIALTVSERFTEAMSSTTFSEQEMLTIRSTRTMRLRRKDGIVINTLQQGFIPLVKNGMPDLQLIIMTDITSFNSNHEHFYSLRVTRDDGEEEILVFGCIEGVDENITIREREILFMISRGFTSAGIASKLLISKETVKTHRKNLMKKATVKNSIDLVCYGYAHGWL